jgi:hypothetical protein
MQLLDVEKLKEGLAESPVFNFSLGSKELFHSNFIAWLAVKYPQETGKLFSDFLKNKNGNISIEKVKREKKNKDLWLFFKNGQELIIENKVKSIPDIGQLKAYDKESLNHQNFLLLTLIEPSFDLPNGWNKLSYAQLSVLMENTYINLENIYDSQIIKDYIFVISSLGRIFKDITVKSNDKFCFYSEEGDYIYKALRDLRMGDVYQKLKYQMFAVEVFKRLQEAFPVEKIFFNSTINRFKKDDSLQEIKDKDRQEGCFYFGCGMTRSQGMMEVVYVLKKGLFLTMQIQGDRYKKMVQGYAGYMNSGKVAELLRAKDLWFNFNHFGNNLKEYPKKDKVFNKYGKTDFYRSVSLSFDYTIDEIINFVIDDINGIKSNLATMNDVLSLL